MIIVLLHTQLGKFKHKKTGDPLLKEDPLSDVSFFGVVRTLVCCMRAAYTLLVLERELLHTTSHDYI